MKTWCVCLAAVLLLTVSACVPTAPVADSDFSKCWEGPTKPREVAADENASSACTRVIARQNETPEKLTSARTNRGWLEARNGAKPAAQEDFDIALSISPDFIGALSGRAALLVNSGHSDRALADYDHVIKIDPKNIHAFIGRGDAHNNLRQYDEGIIDFDKALALEPKNEEALNDRAFALERKGAYSDAISGYDDALTVATWMRGHILMNRCMAKAMIGETDAALADCDKGIELESKKAGALSLRGLVNLKGKRLTGAIADYDAALAVDSQNAAALYGRGIARLQSGQEDLGRSDIETAEKLQPTIREKISEFGVRAPLFGS